MLVRLEFLSLLFNKLPFSISWTITAKNVHVVDNSLFYSIEITGSESKVGYVTHQNLEI